MERVNPMIVTHIYICEDYFHDIKEIVTIKYAILLHCSDVMYHYQKTPLKTRLLEMRYIISESSRDRI